MLNATTVRSKLRETFKEYKLPGVDVA